MTSTRTTSDELVSRIREAASDDRLIIAIVGAPGSGKSTTVGRICDALNAEEVGRAAVLPMDGFHYDDAILKEIGRLPYKGAPDTFDVGGLIATLKRIKANEENEIAVPVFDRDLEVSRGSARLIPAGTQIILVEGNWLLLDEEPWPRLRPLFDMTVMIEVPEAELRRRLTKRWEGYGLSDDEMAHKLDGNDIPNGRRVVHESCASDFILTQP